mgnify:CR=1 FL=1
MYKKLQDSIIYTIDEKYELIQLLTNVWWTSSERQSENYRSLTEELAYIAAEDLSEPDISEEYRNLIRQKLWALTDLLDDQDAVEQIKSLIVETYADTVKLHDFFNCIEKRWYQFGNATMILETLALLIAAKQHWEFNTEFVEILIQIIVESRVPVTVA